MENPDDKYLWKTDKEEFFPKLTVYELAMGFLRFLIFISFTLCSIPLFLLAKLFFKQTGIKKPMVAIRRYWSLVTLRLCSLKLKVYFTMYYSLFTFLNLNSFLFTSTYINIK